MKAIIFDFNRTLYDPGAAAFFLGTSRVLKELSDKSYSLFLFAQAAPGRKQLIEDANLSQFFKDTLFTEKKSVTLLHELIAKNDIEADKSFMIGDRVRKEIALGNLVGLLTIWLAAGKFADEKPRNKIEQPDFTVKKLTEILKHIP